MKGYAKQGQNTGGIHIRLYVQIGMMGYAKQGQNTGGIHIRLYARSYIIEVTLVFYIFYTKINWKAYTLVKVN